MQAAKAHMLAHRALWAPVAGSEAAAVRWQSQSRVCARRGLQTRYRFGALAEEVAQVRAMAAAERHMYLPAGPLTRRGRLRCDSPLDPPKLGARLGRPLLPDSDDVLAAWYMVIVLVHTHFDNHWVPS